VGQSAKFQPAVGHKTELFVDLKIALWVFVVLSLYLLPSLVALGRKKADSGMIFVLNFLLGYTGVGWIAALIWSLRTQEVDLVAWEERPAPFVVRLKIIVEPSSGSSPDVASRRPDP
jgi:hypothetical protein